MDNLSVLGFVFYILSVVSSVVGISQGTPRQNQSSRQKQCLHNNITKTQSHKHTHANNP